MFPIGAHTWCRVLGVPDAHQLQAQIISRAMKLLQFCPITPAHRKPPWPEYKHGLRLFTKSVICMVDKGYLSVMEQSILREKRWWHGNGC